MDLEAKFMSPQLGQSQSPSLRCISSSFCSWVNLSGGRTDLAVERFTVDIFRVDNQFIICILQL
jgi:hypothetical protein